MSSTTPRSGMPLLAAAQAQKHVTHNEALLQLDALGCARILDRDLTAPPPSPSDGDTYLIHATATGDWAGQDGRIAYALGGGWRFYAPFAGLMAYVVDEAKPIVFDGTAWGDFVSLLSLENIPMLGINTTADATNKFAVKSSAVLLDNIGNGIQAKLNKNASGDTASILYQTSYSGRAEFGLTGDDNFHCKVSPDGSSWTDALVIDKTSGALTLAAAAKLPNGSASAPALVFNTNTGLFYDTTNSGVGISVAGAEVGYIASGSATFSLPGAGYGLTVQSEGATSNTVSRYTNDNQGPALNINKARGTIASPSVPQTNDVIGGFTFRPYSGAGFTQSGLIRALLTETGTVSTSALGTQIQVRMCPIGSGTVAEVARFDNESGLSMFGANPVIDQNRGHRLRSTTISGAITPSVAGNLFFHSDAQGGAGEVAVDTGSAYRYAGQAAVKKFTSNADATYTPRADGRIVRDSAALTADRKLTLLTTNITDGYKVEVSRRGSSGGHNRGVYQADGTTLIVNIADNASADFIYDATAALWFQK